MADPDSMAQTREGLLEPGVMADRVHRILESNFVKMTFPVFNALYDAANPDSDRPRSATSWRGTCWP